MSINHDTILTVLIPFQAVSIGGIIYLVKLVRDLSNVLYQHDLMWYEYARDHGLPAREGYFENRGPRGHRRR